MLSLNFSTFTKNTTFTIETAPSACISVVGRLAEARLRAQMRGKGHPEEKLKGAHLKTLMGKDGFKGMPSKVKSIIKPVSDYMVDGATTGNLLLMVSPSLETNDTSAGYEDYTSTLSTDTEEPSPKKAKKSHSESASSARVFCFADDHQMPIATSASTTLGDLVTEIEKVYNDVDIKKGTLKDDRGNLTVSALVVFTLGGVEHGSRVYTLAHPFASDTKLSEAIPDLAQSYIGFRFSRPEAVVKKLKNFPGAMIQASKFVVDFAEDRTVDPKRAELSSQLKKGTEESVKKMKAVKKVKHEFVTFNETFTLSTTGARNMVAIDPSYPRPKESDFLASAPFIDALPGTWKVYVVRLDHSNWDQQHRYRVLIVAHEDFPIKPTMALDRAWKKVDSSEVHVDSTFAGIFDTERWTPGNNERDDPGVYTSAGRKTVSVYPEGVLVRCPHGDGHYTAATRRASGESNPDNLVTAVRINFIPTL